MLSRKRTYRSGVEGVRDRKRERAYQRRYAKRHGYYWLPCILCGTEHGGHEAGGTVATNPRDEHGGMTICPWCTAERQEAAERHLRETGQFYETQTTRWGFEGVMAHRVGFRPRGTKQDSIVVYYGGQSAA